MFRRQLYILLFLSAAFAGSTQSEFYDEGKLQKIELHFSQLNWDRLLDTARFGHDGFLLADWVKINGRLMDSVGVKYKGNSSYDSTFLKNPLHIELDTYKDQDYEGYSDIKLSNGYADPSLVREVLAYSILGNYMPCPRSNFAQLYVNGSYIGLYSNSESVNKDFCASHFYSANGTFVKCNPYLTPSPSVKSNLLYLPGDSSAYAGYYEMKSDYGWKHLRALCDTLTNKPASIASVVNIDRMIWMLAFNNLLVNLDSYNGAFAQNYYLYRDQNGLFNPIVWDLNMSFGGFPFAGNSNTSLGSLNISAMQNLSPALHAADPFWPVIKAIQNNSTCRKMYIAHLKTMTSEQFASNLYVTRFTELQQLIDTAVLSDTRKFYSYQQFQNALSVNTSVGSYSVPGIQTLMSARVAYLQASADFLKTTPVISQVKHGSTALNQPVALTAQVNGASQVYLYYRFTGSAVFTRADMYDDGLHSDAGAGDGTYGTNIVLSGNALQYYIYAENNDAGIFSPERAEQEFHTLNLFPQAGKGQVVINEFLANNKSDVKNEFHASEDWIELYNQSSSELSLSGLYLSDKISRKAGYALPLDKVIQPGEFLTLWADEFVGGKQLHTQFKLNEEGDNIVLSDGLSAVLDSYAYTVQEQDVSLARCPDGTGPFLFNTRPSFGMSNCVVALDENLIGLNQLVVFPNPAKDIFTVGSSSANEVCLEIVDIQGSTVLNTHFRSRIDINSKQWAAGVYIVKCNAQAQKLIITN